jgi:endogenous inhibitor of DNA gyrase (YacG/DUF329 family)
MPGAERLESKSVSQCPVCGRPAREKRTAPFCGARCADVDLGRWLSEQYRVPVRPDQEDDE